eukprot:10575605-Alexandrium_andersonii.AAC.1
MGSRPRVRGDPCVRGGRRRGFGVRRDRVTAYDAVANVRDVVVQGLCGARGTRPVSYTHLTLPTICSV